MLPEKFYNTDNIARHAEQTHGSYWFSAGTKGFFNSRVGSNVYPCENPYLYLFVSSERYDWLGNHPRLYSVRCYDCRTGNIDTIGEFQQYRSSSGAHNAARRIAPALLATIEELHEWGIVLNEKYDVEMRRALHRGERKFYVSDIGYVLTEIKILETI